MKAGNEPLAHSSREGVAAQTYKAHIERVTEIAVNNAKRAGRYLREGSEFFVDSVHTAAIYHDLGKLDEENQQVLRSSPKDRLPINHVDAGTCRLLEMNRFESSLLVFAHHVGLPSVPAEWAKEEKCRLRDARILDHTNHLMRFYSSSHGKIIKWPVSPLKALKAKWSGLTRRIALSCLVDADHTDTAEHYGNERPVLPLKLRAAERLAALDKYVNSLRSAISRGSSSARELKRNEIRQQVYDACRDAPVDSSMLVCDSPVGTGKTTAIMAHLLKAAVAKDLRHIFVILPYTNIIKQSVEIYRKAVILKGENPNEVVGEHHHQADFSSRELRHLASLWNTPVVVTTAVQFFETLGNNYPSRLRKLHEVAGSAIMVDESHAAMPAWLWPQVWLWLRELADNWGCHIVFASGSLVRFWELKEFVSPEASIPDLIQNAARRKASLFEVGRVSYHTRKSPMNLKTLLDFVLEKPGPRLIILNTVQSAAVVADKLRGRSGRNGVYHLSTALCPRDRDTIVKKVTDRLKSKKAADWTLVATSCVEAGMDFSFRTALRESCGLVNLIQIGGRINRSGEYTKAEVWDFRILDPLLRPHPAFDTSRSILEEFFREMAVDALSATEAMRREVQRDPLKRSERIRDAEKKLDYPEVAKLCRVIESDTRTVVVDHSVIDALENHIQVTHIELIRNSVQIWSMKVSSLPTRPLRGHEDLYAWTGDYDPDFLGYMAGALPLIYAQKSGVLIL